MNVEPETKASVPVKSLAEWMESRDAFKADDQLLEAVKPALINLHDLACSLADTFENIVKTLCARFGTAYITRPGWAVKSIESMFVKAGRYAASGDRIFAHVFNDTLAATIFVQGGVKALQSIHEELNGALVGLAFDGTGFVVKPRGVGKPVQDACYITLQHGLVLCEVQFWCPTSYAVMKRFHEFAKVPDYLKSGFAKDCQAYRALYQLIAWARDEAFLSPELTPLGLLNLSDLPGQLKALVQKAIDKLPKDHHGHTFAQIAWALSEEPMLTWFGRVQLFLVDPVLDSTEPLGLRELQLELELRTEKC